MEQPSRNEVSNDRFRRRSFRKSRDVFKREQFSNNECGGTVGRRWRKFRERGTVFEVFSMGHSRGINATSSATMFSRFPVSMIRRPCCCSCIRERASALIASNGTGDELAPGEPSLSYPVSVIIPPESCSRITTSRICCSQRLICLPVCGTNPFPHPSLWFFSILLANRQLVSSIFPSHDILFSTRTPLATLVN